MRKTLLLCLVFFISLGLKAQLTVSKTMTPEELVQNILAGNGVQVSNVVFNGIPANSIDSMCGSFISNGTNLGLSAGVIIGSGDVDIAAGPNDLGGQTGDTAEIFVTDPDLDLIATNNLQDVAVLEFDFIPIGDTVSFRYVFASEEYNEYVCSNFNDVFGFFISGPGINGPFSNNAENIARIPGTTTAVAINTINLGVPGSSGEAINCESIDPNWESYSIYYNNNTQNFIQYDGMTQVLTALSPVQCGETYHIKLAIADAGDQSFDSGVFLEASSLSSLGVNISLQTVTGDDIIYESCTPAQFVFTRPEAMLGDTTIVNYELTGTAVEGVDYDFLQDTVVFLPGEDTVALNLNAFQDNIDEGNETVIVTATYISDCGDTIVATTNLTLSEDPIFDAIKNAPEVFCPDDSIQMTIQALGGTPPYTYTWSNGEAGDTVFGSINGIGTETYTVQVVDFCGFIYNDSVTITQSPPPAIDLTVTAQLATCIEDSVLMIADAQNGVQPLTLSWSNGGTQAIVYGLTAGFPTYYVTVTDACGNVKVDSVTIQPAPDPVLVITVPDELVFCPTDSIVLTALAGNGFVPYTYTWSTAEVNDTILGSINGVGTVTYYVSAVDVCGNSTPLDSALITQTTAPAINILLTAPLVSCIEDSVLVSAFPSGGAPPLEPLNWSNGGTGNQVYVLTAGLPTYTVTATDFCGNTETESITLQAQPDPVLTISAPDRLLQCPDDEVIVTASAGSGFAPYTYTWSNGTVNDSNTVAIASNGTISFQVTAADICGNTISDSVHVMLNKTLNIDSLTAEPASSCVNNGATNSFVIGNTGAINYSWTGPGTSGGVVSTGPSAVNLGEGTYYLVVSDNVCSDSASIFVDALNPPVADFSIVTTLAAAPQTVTFSNTSQNADSYEWDFGNGEGVIVATTADQSSLYTDNITYTVTLYAIQQSCIDSMKLSFELIGLPSYHLPNIFTPNGDTLNAYFTLSPVNFSSFSYSIFNRWGNLIFEGDLSSPKWDGVANNGKEAEEAVYFYKYSGVALNGEVKQGHGYFHLKK
jgi:gliding motility-associated-like protein